MIKSMSAKEGTTDRVDEDRRSRIEGGTEDSPPTGRTVISRRAVLGGAAGGALVTLLARPELAWAQGSEPPTLIVLLRGLYQPVTDGPDLGLSGVDLNDGSYSTTKIYPVSGFKNRTDVLESCGDFYSQFEGNLCAYDLPGGAIKMKFTGGEHRGRRRWVGRHLHAGNLGAEGQGGNGSLREVRGWSQHDGR